MNINDLKLFAGNTITESDMSTESKKQMLQFIIKEANEAQLKSIVLDKKIVTLDEGVKDVINARFDNYLENLYEQVSNDSINFSLSAREAIVSCLETSNLPETELKESTNFILKEASDYQIACMLFEEDFTKEYSPEKEVELFEAISFQTGEKIIPIFESKEITTYLSEDAGFKDATFDTASPSNFKVNKIGLGTKAKDKARAFYKNTSLRGKELYNKVSGAASKQWNKLSPKGKSTAKVIGAVVGVSIIFSLANKIYRNYFSKMAKQCKGAAEGKSACMQKARISALNAKLSALQSSLGKCNQTTNPDKCRKSIERQILKTGKKIKRGTNTY